MFLCTREKTEQTIVLFAESKLTGNVNTNVEQTETLLTIDVKYSAFSNPW